ncbi:hypothetical protein Y1Q_0009617 [Alligator mississippiensis]|uniref:Uncharacterized protein n=1 Tax=Alligator mississippiensis TaxID=8496 RepID=A0A151NW03_ALLMI|nr:hypothetical protein Y1Q_0009617 [Alligator mississippiensis]
MCRRGSSTPANIGLCRQEEVLYRPTNKFSVAAPRPAIHPYLSGFPYDTNVQHRDSHQYLGKANVNHFQGVHAQHFSLPLEFI